MWITFEKPRFFNIEWGKHLLVNTDRIEAIRFSAHKNHIKIWTTEAFFRVPNTKHNLAQIRKIGNIEGF